MRRGVKVVIIVATVAIVIGGTLIAYLVIRSSQNSLAHDKQVGANVGAIAPFVDKWHVHGSSLIIHSDGTGVEWSNAGPCSDSFSDPASPMCAENEDIVFTANVDETITGKITKVWYTEWDGTPAPPGYDPGPNGPRIGDLFKLHRVKAGLIITTWLNRPDIQAGVAAGGNAYWCGSNYDGVECGA